LITLEIAGCYPGDYQMRKILQISVEGRSVGRAEAKRENGLKGTLFGTVTKWREGAERCRSYAFRSWRVRNLTA
jgi:hypothetical protein